MCLQQGPHVRRRGEFSGTGGMKKAHPGMNRPNGVVAALQKTLCAAQHARTAGQALVQWTQQGQPQRFLNCPAQPTLPAPAPSCRAACSLTRASPAAPFGWGPPQLGRWAGAGKDRGSAKRWCTGHMPLLAGWLPTDPPAAAHLRGRGELPPNHVSQPRPLTTPDQASSDSAQQGALTVLATRWLKAPSSFSSGTRSLPLS